MIEIIVTDNPFALFDGIGTCSRYTAYNRLALIITRLDADEAVDPAGTYGITLNSAASSND